MNKTKTRIHSLATGMTSCCKTASTLSNNEWVCIACLGPIEFDGELFPTENEEA